MRALWPIVLATGAWLIFLLYHAVVGISRFRRVVRNLHADIYPRTSVLTSERISENQGIVWRRPLTVRGAIFSLVSNVLLTAVLTRLIAGPAFGAWASGTTKMFVLAVILINSVFAILDARELLRLSKRPAKQPAQPSGGAT